MCACLTLWVLCNYFSRYELYMLNIHTNIWNCQIIRMIRFDNFLLEKSKFHEFRYTTSVPILSLCGIVVAHGCSCIQVLSHWLFFYQFENCGMFSTFLCSILENSTVVTGKNTHVRILESNRACLAMFTNNLNMFYPYMTIQMQYQVITGVIISCRSTLISMHRHSHWKFIIFTRQRLTYKNIYRLVVWVCIYSYIKDIQLHWLFPNTFYRLRSFIIPQYILLNAWKLYIYIIYTLYDFFHC